MLGTSACTCTDDLARPFPSARHCCNSLVAAVATSNSASTTTGSKRPSKIVPSHDSQPRQMVTFPPGVATTTKPTAHRDKTSPSDGDVATFVALTLNDDHHHDAGRESARLSHGVAVQLDPRTTGKSSLGSRSNDQLDKTSELQSVDIVDQASSLVVTAQLPAVTRLNEDYKEYQCQALENRIEQDGESLLKKRDPTLALAHPFTTIIDATRKKYSYKWKYAPLSPLLWMCVVLAGLFISSRLDETFPAELNPLSINKKWMPSSTRNNEIQARIKDILQQYLTIEEDPTNGSPQSCSLEWLLFHDTNNLMENGSVSDTVILERYALAVLFYSTNGDTWQQRFDFLTQNHVCQWADAPLEATMGVLCDMDGKVQQIVLYENGLNGTIPSELSLLSHLQHLDMTENTLGNGIPTDLGRLTALRELFLDTNQLHGTVPTELGHLTALQTLSIFSNHLFGTLPTELDNLVVLERISLSGNQFHGTLPTELSRLTNLQSFQGAPNFFTGPLPTELGLLTSLTALTAGHNLFTGTFPTELGRLTKLEVLDMNSNKLMGPVPTELGLMTSLTGFFASYNFFTGTLPTELGHLTALEYLHVRRNYLNGTIPDQVANKFNVKVDFDPQRHPKRSGRNSP